MKKLLYFLLTALFTFTTIVAQSSSSFVYTPNGSMVSVKIVNYYAVTGYDLDTLMDKYQVVEMGPATPQYNCHGYAWHMRDEMYGGLNAFSFVNLEYQNQSIDKYTQDYSYIEINPSITPISEGNKVLYPGYTHSAVVFSDTNFFISKWDTWPLFKHPKGLSQYNPKDDTSGFRYFKANPLRITGSVHPLNEVSSSGTQFTLEYADGSITYPLSWSLSGSSFSFNSSSSSSDTTNCTTVTVYAIGANSNEEELTVNMGGKITKKIIRSFIPTPTITSPTLICTGQSYSFSVSDAPGGFNWDKSSNLTLSNTTDASISVTGTATGLGWVSIKLGATEFIRKDIWVGAPSLTGLSGPLNVTPNSGYSTYTAQFNALTAPSSFQFTVTSNSGGGYYLLHNDNDANWRHTANIIFYDNGQYVVSSRACNACGWSGWYNIFVQSGRGAIAAFAYPNPADNVLYVDLDIFAQANPSPLILVPTYDVRLYDGSGNMVLQQRAQGGILQFDVSRLPDGFYYLIIYDGSNSNPVTQTIIVRH